MTPKNTRSKKKQKYETVEQKLKKIAFNQHAVSSGFIQRKGKKITAKALLISFITMAMQGKNSFQQWAEHLSLQTGKTVSKQGIWKRVSPRLTRFLALVLLDVLYEQTNTIQTEANKHKCLKKYKRVLLQDSTVIGLPYWLSWCYPGTVSKGKQTAQLKIQVVYDILASQFVYFEVTPYTANDQSKAKDILHITTSDDLVIRDLGYFVLGSFDGMISQGTSFISRLRYGLTICEAETGKELNLLNQLKKAEQFDRWIMIGREQKLKVRLVAIKLSAEQAERRRRKAKNDRDKRLNHSKEYYQLLGYNLFITHEEDTALSATQIAQLYQLRWRIETIFKCWKSNFNLQKLIPRNCPLNKERTEAIIYMMLIFILLFQTTIYNAALSAAQKVENCFISLVRLCKYIANNINLFLETNLNEIMPQILYYCRYEKRHDRQNFIQNLKLG